MEYLFYNGASCVKGPKRRVNVYFDTNSTRNLCGLLNWTSPVLLHRNMQRGCIIVSPAKIIDRLLVILLF